MYLLIQKSPISNITHQQYSFLRIGVVDKVCHVLIIEDISRSNKDDLPSQYLHYFLDEFHCYAELQSFLIRVHSISAAALEKKRNPGRPYSIHRSSHSNNQEYAWPS
eukprot:gene8772-9506_t